MAANWPSSMQCKIVHVGFEPQLNRKKRLPKQTKNKIQVLFHLHFLQEKTDKIRKTIPGINFPLNCRNWCWFYSIMNFLCELNETLHARKPSLIKNYSIEQQTIDMMWMHAAHESEVDCRVWYFRSCDARANSVGDDVVAKHVLCGVTLRYGFCDGKVIKSRFNRECLAHTAAHAQAHRHVNTGEWTDTKKLNTHSNQSLFRRQRARWHMMKLKNVYLISIHQARVHIFRAVPLAGIPTEYWSFRFDKKSQIWTGYAIDEFDDVHDSRNTTVYDWSDDAHCAWFGFFATYLQNLLVFSTAIFLWFYRWMIRFCAAIWTADVPHYFTFKMRCHFIIVRFRSAEPHMTSKCREKELKKVDY